MSLTRLPSVRQLLRNAAAPMLLSPPTPVKYHQSTSPNLSSLNSYTDLTPFVRQPICM